MNRFAALTKDQQDVYFEIVRNTNEFQQFIQWLNLSSRDAKQILAALPVEISKSFRFLVAMIEKNGDYNHIISYAYPGEPSKVSYTIQRVKKFWDEKVIVLTWEDELEYEFLKTRI